MLRRLLVPLMLSTLSINTAYAAEEVVVYSARIEQLIKPMFDVFTKETGIQVKYITDKEGPLMERLRAEGANTPADILLTVDAGNLWQASNLGLLKPVQSSVLDANIPPHLKDPEGQWYGLSVRARTIVYNNSKVKPADLSTYEALGDAKWKNRLCLRSSKKVYNQSLVAMMIAEKGEAETEKVVKSWVNNLATDVFPDDTKMMEAIAAGQCDVGITNTYYYGRLMEKNPKRSLALFWPNQETSGVHVNISGAGLVKHSKHEAQAIRLMEFLSSETAQKMYAEINMEYPANPNIRPDPVVAKWGSFKHNLINIAKAGELQASAVRLMDRARYK